jgi:aspartate kinase
MAHLLGKYERAVIPGFYGSMPNGTIKTFSRGGSDITGAIVARAANADVYENWTDVSGFLMCDPRIVDSPKPISVITYKELRELAYMGATVLHEDSIFPVKQAGIPINIKNTNAPADHGTLIVTEGDTHKSKDIITGIAGKKDLSIIHLEKDMMNAEVGFGMKVLKALYNMGISFEHLPSGIDTMSIVVNSSYIEGREKQVIDKITEAVSPDVIYVDNGLALIAIVGRGMKNAHGTASRIFKAIASESINIRMIDQGSSELNIIIGVANTDYEKCIHAIYKAFA